MSRKRSAEEMGSVSSLPVGVISNASEHSAIKSAINEVKILLEAGVERVTSHAEGLDDTTVQKWKEKLELLLNKIARVQYKDEVVDQAITEALSSYASQDVEALVLVDETDMASRAMDKLTQKAAAYTLSKDSKYFALLEQLHQAEEDRELVVQEDSLNEQKIKCPYTGLEMKEPMKKFVNLSTIMFLFHLLNFTFYFIFFFCCSVNGNKKCTHHVSREGLREMMRLKKPGCPIAGCKGVWSESHAIMDEDFKLKIERYKRQRDRSNQLSGDMLNTYEIDDN